MSKVVQSVRSVSSIDRFVQKFRDLMSSVSRHSSISVALIVAVGLGLMSLTGISGVLFGSSAAYADESVRYDVNVNSSLTLGFSANTVSLNLNPGSKTFASQDITTTVSTNNQYGYDLYVTSNGTDLINQTDNTKTISTLPAKEGGYDADTFLADKWGVMKNNTSYQPFVPGATVSQSSTVTNADNTVLTFGAKTSYNTAPGNYKLLLTFQLIPRVATNDLTINFGGSGVAEVKVCKVAGDCTGDDLVGRVTASGGLVPGLKDGSTYYLYPVFSTGYEFVSWAKTSSDASVISDTTILNPTFTMSDEPASVTVTGKATPIGYCDNNNIADANCMQRMTASTCTTTAKTVYDDRDGSAYMVQRLSDGKCWLLDNLRLGYAGFASGVTALNSTNTNTTNSIATSTFAGWNTTSDFLSYDTPMINTASADTTTTGYGSGSKKIGVYYNYCAATMQSYCYAESKGTGNASQDVCPKGWRMPTGGSNGEYQALCTAVKGSSCSSGYGGDNSADALKLLEALSTPLSGYFYNSSITGQGSYGCFWASTYGHGSSMHYLDAHSSIVYPQGYAGRTNGISVRCVLK